MSLVHRPEQPEARKLTRRVHVSEAYDAYCGRRNRVPFEWSGPGCTGDFGNYAPGGTVVAFEPWFARRIADEPAFARKVQTLRGKRLACFCRKDARCHVDVIIEHLDKTDPTLQGALSRDRILEFAERISKRRVKE